MSGDLKAVFGQTNDGSAEGEEGANWDKVEEEEGGGEEEQLPPSLLSADPSSKSEESSGFRFSFFGDESAAGSGETGESHQFCSSDPHMEQISVHLFNLPNS